MSRFSVQISPEALADTKRALRKQPEKRKRVKKAIRLLEEEGPRHPSLHSHLMRGMEVLDEPVWTSYVENHTPGAWRIYWLYWGKDSIRIVYIGPHQ